MTGVGLAGLMSGTLGPLSGVGAARPASFPGSRNGSAGSGDGTDRAEEGRFGPAVVVSFARSGGSGRASEAGAGNASEGGSARQGARAGGRSTGGNAVQGDGLTEEERDQISELKARDREVRTHEAAHMMAGGQHASGPTYTYQAGPDGQRYAIGGEVQIDTSPEKDPEATIAKMEIVKRAALAPAEPSAQDVKVAQMAEQQRAQAQAELSRRKTEEAEGTGGGTGKEQGRGEEGGSGDDAGRMRAGEFFAAAVMAYGNAGRLGEASGPTLFRTA